MWKLQIKCSNRSYILYSRVMLGVLKTCTYYKYILRKMDLHSSTKIILSSSHFICNVLQYIGANQSQALKALPPLSACSDHTVSFLFQCTIRACSAAPTDRHKWLAVERAGCNLNHISLFAPIFNIQGCDFLQDKCHKQNLPFTQTISTPRTFVTMTTTKFFSLILYSLRAVSSLRILPEKEKRKMSHSSVGFT